MRQPEQRVWDTMRNARKRYLKEHQIVLQRIEYRLEAGIPDLFVKPSMCDAAWVELKAPLVPKNMTTRLFRDHAGLKTDQENWALRYVQANGRWFLVARDSDNEIYMFGKSAILDINNMSVEQARDERIAKSWLGVFDRLCGGEILI